MDLVFSINFPGPNHWSCRQVLECCLSDAERPESPVENNRLLESHIDDQLKIQFGEVSGSEDYLRFQNDSDRIAFLARSLQHAAGVSTKPLVAGSLQRKSSYIESLAGKLPNGDVSSPSTPCILGTPCILSTPCSLSIIAIEFEEEKLARDCIQTALRLFKQLRFKQPIDWTAEKRRLVELADVVRLGPSSRAILRAASERGVPYYRMNCGSLVQLGEGVFQRRIWTAETDATSAIAESIAKDKQFTRTLLAAAGVPVPKGRLVTDPADACAAAEEVGLPVVVKPCDANHARGISLDLRDHDSICKAYDWAKEDGETEEVMVEQYIEGDHHRILVIGEKMIAAAKGQREYVTGNGRDTIEELVAEVNRDPRRGENYTDQLGVLKLDPAALIELSKQSVTPDTIIKNGQKILVRHVGDLIEDVTAKVHPTTAAIAVLAAKVIGLDIAGMDLVVKDISVPLSEQRGCIIEVNAGPSLAHHVEPLVGEPQPVGDAILRLLFPSVAAEPDDQFPNLSIQGKVPIVFLLTRDTLSNKSHELEIFFSAQGEYVGVADYQSIRCGGHMIEQIASPKAISMSSVSALLMHPLMTMLIVEASVENVFDTGVPAPRADFLILDADSMMSDREVDNDSDDKLFAALTACRNALSPNSIVVLSSSQDDVVRSTMKTFEKFFGQVFHEIEPYRIKTYESLFRIQNISRS